MSSWLTWKPQKRDGTSTRWVHGEANIADSLTKAGAEKVILEFMTNFRSLIVHDEKQRSARKRKNENLCVAEEDVEILARSKIW